MTRQPNTGWIPCRLHIAMQSHTPLTVTTVTMQTEEINKQM